MEYNTEKVRDKELGICQCHFRNKQGVRCQYAVYMKDQDVCYYHYAILTGGIQPTEFYSVADDWKKAWIKRNKKKEKINE